MFDSTPNNLVDEAFRLAQTVALLFFKFAVSDSRLSNLSDVLSRLAHTCVLPF